MGAQGPAVPQPRTKGTQLRGHGLTPPCHSDRVQVSPWCPHTRAGARGAHLSPGSGGGLDPRGRLCAPRPYPRPGARRLPDPLTGAAELILLDLGHVEAAELGRSRALGEEPDGGALAEPLRQPGQVAVAEEVVGVQAAAGGRGVSGCGMPPAHHPELWWPPFPQPNCHWHTERVRRQSRGTRGHLPRLPRPPRLEGGRGVPSNPSVPSRPHGPHTHKVRSLGMWLKLDTGMEVMLLLFRVLQEGRGGQVRAARS